MNRITREALTTVALRDYGALSYGDKLWQVYSLPGITPEVSFTGATKGEVYGELLRHIIDQRGAAVSQVINAMEGMANNG